MSGVTATVIDFRGTNMGRSCLRKLLVSMLIPMAGSAWGGCSVDHAGIDPGPGTDAGGNNVRPDAGPLDTTTVLVPDGGPDTGSTDSAGMDAPVTRATFYVNGRDILDSCGNKFVARGVNHPTMYVDRAGDAVPEIARTGANVVRVFWSVDSGVSLADAEPIVARLEQAGMVAMIELNDSTCAWNLDGIAAAWTGAAATALVARHPRSVWINIASEASPPSASTYVSRYGEIVRAIRGAGTKVPLVIDAGGCGRDSGLLFQAGSSLQNADPEHNLIFSWHFYDPLSQSQITQVFQQAVAANLPFIVGEFADRSPPGCGPAVDYKFMMAEAQRLGIGWLAWSWGDNDPTTTWNADCPEFDMTRTFAFSTLLGWGLQVAVNDPNSIRNTATAAHGLGGTCP